MKLLLYCTKAKPSLMKYENIEGYYTDTDPVLDKRALLNGEIVAECDFEVEKINCSSVFNHCYATWNLGQDELLKFSCLERKQLVDYLGLENQIDGKWCGYAIHIKNLHIFDTPRKLEFYFTDKPYKTENLFTDEIHVKDKWYRSIKTAPQNMMYVYEDLENKHVLISIKPEWLCKILNGEKTIEIRKKILKEMLR